MKRQVIAKKEAGVFLVYAIVFVLSLLLFGGAIAVIAPKSEVPLYENPLVWIVVIGGLVCCGIFGYRGVVALKTPEIILETDGVTLFLPNGKTVALTEVQAVEYKKAKSRGYEYDYGDLTVVTAAKKYKLSFVEDVVKAQTELLAFVEKAKKEK